MKRTYLLAALVVILGATYAIEYYANSQFETEELVITGVPTFSGQENEYRYLKSQELVGSYTYSVEQTGSKYTLTSLTDVSLDGQGIELSVEFLFDEELNPEEYTLNVVGEDNQNEIRSEFQGDEVITFVSVEGEAINITETFTQGTLLVDLNMPGLWEVLFNSAPFEGGVKYTGSIYIPQVGVPIDINLVVSRNPQNIRIDGEQLSCKVIKEADLGLAFFIYEGELVQMRDDPQELLFQKVR